MEMLPFLGLVEALKVVLSIGFKSLGFDLGRPMLLPKSFASASAASLIS